MVDSSKAKLFPLIMLNITAVVSLSSIAYMATMGMKSFFYYIFAAIFFLIPSALVCAELSGMMTNSNGGVFEWVRAAFGDTFGSIAIWMEWFNNVISFPVNISSLVASVVYLAFGNRLLGSNTLVILILLIFWLVTFFNFLPLKKVLYLNIIGALCGMILPGSLLICGAIYFILHHDSNISINSYHNFIPGLSLASYAILVKTLSGYSGMQSVAFHMKNISNPQKNIPIAILISVVVILSLTILSTGALVVIIPSGSINVLDGLVQAISLFLDSIGLHMLKPLIVILIAIGMLSALSTYILGPAKGMQAAAEKKVFPKIFAKKNKNGMPVNTLLIQLVIGMLITLFFLEMPTIYSAYALLIALTSQFTVLMWVMVFMSVIRLRYKMPNLYRPFYIGSRKKSGNLFLIIIVSLAIVSCILGFIAGMFPPSFSKVTNISWYIMLVISVDIVIILIPIIWISVFKKAILKESINFFDRKINTFRLFRR